jgi:hypothetical protein
MIFFFGKRVSLLSKSDDFVAKQQDISNLQAFNQISGDNRLIHY